MLQKLEELQASRNQPSLSIDMFWDNVMSVSNDILKTVINSFCHTSGVRAECEVFGMFRDIIPVEALGEEEGLQRGRGRQGLLPDFRLELPSQAAGEPHLNSDLQN